MKEQENAQKLLEKFTNRNLQDGNDFSFRVYALERKDNLYKDKDGVTYSYPHLTGNIYFVAEVAINLGPRGGWSLHQHFFQLDLASIKIELEKIAEMNPISNLLRPDGIARVLNDHYAEVSSWLLDYNGFGDNYKEIAALLYKNHALAFIGRLGL